MEVDLKMCWFQALPHPTRVLLSQAPAQALAHHINHHQNLQVVIVTVAAANGIHHHHRRLTNLQVIIKAAAVAAVIQNSSCSSVCFILWNKNLLFGLSCLNKLHG